MRDGRLSRARVYHSAKLAAGPRPLVMYIFGGRWAFSDPAQVAMQAKAVAEATGAVVMSLTASRLRTPPHMWWPAPALRGDHVMQGDDWHWVSPSLLTLAALNELDLSSPP
ncbi:hypothetical protein AURDEDRAFT_178376 [Auricularia subglabra TFB-10046 SS5]|uniref:Alpha/beta hydrolase fold-3 domain-containing protein n=1 Tax=Auricularia subglabra (strain TFB-10046 / SS5) TaxID=717982 RepID=J0WJT4_AURST|nr:hypothetical protein AURDEDRAFT_178376 [Auricularia subglabra TFB-10046 SS5]